MDQTDPLIEISGFFTYYKAMKLALIGAGGISASWIPAIRETGNSLRVIADVDRKKAEQRAADVPGCRAVADWREACADKEVEAVILAVPHTFLAEMAVAALAAGKHVLSEKPGAISSEEMERISAAEKQSGRRYMIGFNHRFHAAFMEAKKLADAGAIGDLLFVRARYGFGGKPGYEKEWRFKKEMSGGGELIDQGVHMIDLARWFLGDFPKVEGYAENMFWKGGVEDNGFALLRTAKGNVASIHVSWTNWNWTHCFEIYGTDGYLVIDGLDQRYRGPERLTIGKRDPDFANPPSEQIMIFKDEKKETSFARQLQAFTSGEKNLPGVRDAYEVLKIVETIYGRK